MHTCPDSDGPVPHVGGPIISGSPNVFIGGLPAARVTDKLTCVGPPDTIVMGSPTVLINGLMAARMGDQTAHGGVIAGGCGTVLIGTAGAATSSTQGTALTNAANGSGKAFCEHCTK
ncbi:PAAR domain-containing protein [Acidiphilium angustum]|uniref:Zn-binding Pro-Ala-Ala-Arg (PAAR) domain-containing protein, incolved in TypeVI secretion n=2 Tax=Acidiphilium rubrum TaxID=526 RepID=A0A8G2CP03_ACIRU|nr:PAAR domain-containing protein [Acidiphilium angustum]SIR53276.1 Zn-binding Pro-Ala-Ala-Arg (PAAR) domain-containing protein, incolved in TypeVI secretion [Acidiphilium rubrum]